MRQFALIRFEALPEHLSDVFHKMPAVRHLLRFRSRFSRGFSIFVRTISAYDLDIRIKLKLQINVLQADQ